MRVYNPQTGESYFRKRRRRLDEPGHARELTFCCYQRFPFLSRDRTRQWFMDTLATARMQYPFDLWAYVIMPDHVHLLVYPREPKMKLGRIVGEIKESCPKSDQILEEHAPQWLPRITVLEGTRKRRWFWQPGGGFDRNAIEIATVGAFQR